MNMGTFYTTIENQMRTDGSMGLLYDHFTNFNAALAKYYSICAAAAVSEIPYHSAAVMCDDGTIIEGRVFDRRREPTNEANTNVLEE